MTRRRSALGAAALATALLLSAAGCGGDDDTSSSEPGPSAQSDDSGGGGEDEGSGDTGDDTGDDTGAAPAGGVTFVDITDAAAVVMIGPDGFEPGDVTVAVGDVVQFSAVADVDGVYGVIVGDLDGYTVTGGLDEYFRFDQPGTYPVTEDISSATMTVTVE